MLKCNRQVRLLPVFGVFIVLIAGVADGGITKRVVFESGQEGYNVYRIPTIVKATNGDLLAFAEARSAGDASEIDIVMKRSSDNGDSWGPLQVVIENDNYRGWDGLPTSDVTAGNQSPVVDLLDPQYPGRIWLPFTLENDRVFVTYSDDYGQTWYSNTNGRAREITDDVKLDHWKWYATGPVHGIQLTRGTDAGRLIISSDHTFDGAEGSGWGAHVVYSDDHGLTWQLGAIDDQTDTEIRPNENVAVELVDGRVYFNSRDSGSAPGTRSITYSSDGGVTYDGPFVAEPQITTPVVQNSALRFRAVDQGDAENILIHSGPGQPSSRNDMTIRISYDEGETWEVSRVIHSGPSAYSDLVKIDSDHFGVLWEAGDSLYEEILYSEILFNSLLPLTGIDGDVNQDGVFSGDGTGPVETDDLSAFIAGWGATGLPGPEDPLTSYKQGDLNLDGCTDLDDAFLMRTFLLQQGVSAAALADLDLAEVPEPKGLTQALLLGTLLTALSRGRIIGFLSPGG